MSDTPWVYEFEQQPTSYGQQTFQQFTPPTHQASPKLICDFCKQPIEEGDEAWNGLYGIGGRNEKTGLPQVVETQDINQGNFDIHYVCLPGFIKENCPDIASEIAAMVEEEEYPNGHFCENCETQMTGGNEDATDHGQMHRFGGNSG